MYKSLAISFFHSTLPETPTIWATGRKNLGSNFCAFLHEVYLASNDSDISKMVDEATKRTVASIPTLKTKAGPRDSDAWVQRLKEEYTSLIKVCCVLIMGF